MKKVVYIETLDTDRYLIKVTDDDLYLELLFHCLPKVVHHLAIEYTRYLVRNYLFCFYIEHNAYDGGSCSFSYYDERSTLFRSIWKEVSDQWMEDHSKAIEVGTGFNDDLLKILRRMIPPVFIDSPSFRLITEPVYTYMTKCVGSKMIVYDENAPKIVMRDPLPWMRQEFYAYRLMLDTIRKQNSKTEKKKKLKEKKVELQSTSERGKWAAIARRDKRHT